MFEWYQFNSYWPVKQQKALGGALSGCESQRYTKKSYTCTDLEPEWNTPYIEPFWWFTDIKLINFYIWCSTTVEQDSSTASFCTDKEPKYFRCIAYRDKTLFVWVWVLLFTSFWMLLLSLWLLYFLPQKFSMCKCMPLAICQRQHATNI